MRSGIIPVRLYFYITSLRVKLQDTASMGATKPDPTTLAVAKVQKQNQPATIFVKAQTTVRNYLRRDG